MLENAIEHVSSLALNLQAKDIVTPALVVIGWVIVNNQNNKREERKELRSALNEVISFIDGIENDAIAYHTEKREAFSSSDALLVKLNKLSLKLAHSRLPEESYISSYIKFNESITWSNFMTNKFQRQSKNSDLVWDIRDASSDLKGHLETAFFTKFCSPNPIARFISTKQEGIITSLAYFGLITFLWVVSRHLG
ncbi:hypothetical protein D9M68_753510 [compost metagenome]